MATPWVDAAVAWVEGLPGFGSHDVAAGVSCCRAGLVAGGPAVGLAVASQAARLAGTVAEAGWRAAVVGLASRATARVVARDGVGRAWAGGNPGVSRLAGTCGAASGQARTLAGPSACAVAALAGNGLAGTGLREVARLASPVVTGLSLASPVRRALFLTSLVETEQT
ncbi:MAG: hypothetical protein AAGU21_17065 [Solidesulfovibrio sp.]|uniref:hypothetical protein n=1 Tax=Solidesulfovibrio sp. TaxID=2910990 RepID=UPI0031588FC6